MVKSNPKSFPWNGTLVTQTKRSRLTRNGTKFQLNDISTSTEWTTKSLDARKLILLGVGLCWLTLFQRIFHGGSPNTIDDAVGDRGGDHGSASGCVGVRRRHEQSILSVHGHSRAETRRVHAGNRVRVEGQVLLQQRPRFVVSVRLEALSIELELSDLCVQTQGRRDLAPHGQFLLVRRGSFLFRFISSVLSFDSWNNCLILQFLVCVVGDRNYPI